MFQEGLPDVLRDRLRLRELRLVRRCGFSMAMMGLKMPKVGRFVAPFDHLIDLLVRLAPLLLDLSVVPTLLFVESPFCLDELVQVKLLVVFLALVGTHVPSGAVVAVAGCERCKRILGQKTCLRAVGRDCSLRLARAI